MSEETNRHTKVEALAAFMGELQRRNMGRDQGGDRAAIIYTGLRCSRLAADNAVAYPTDVLAVHVREGKGVHISALMPGNWAKQAKSADADPTA